MSDEKEKWKLLPDMSISRFLSSLGLTGLISVFFGQIFPNTISEISPTERFAKDKAKIIPLNKNVEIHQHIEEVTKGNESPNPSFWQQTEKDFTRGVIDGLIIYTALYSIQEGIQLVSRLFSKRQPKAITGDNLQQTQLGVVTMEPLNYRNDWRDKLAVKNHEQKEQSPVTPVRG